jgi:quinol monooxygenase YgiN
MLGRPSDEEALRLVLAFYCIMEPEKRSAVSALAERLARDSESVEGVTHFKLLEDQHNDH